VADLPIVDYLVLGERPHLRASTCADCGARFLDRRNACGSCGGRSLGIEELSTTGTVRSFTVVYRAAPGVPAPFASALVELDGGGFVRSNVVTEDTPDPDALGCGMRVEMVTYEAAVDGAGNRAIAFGFAPMGGEFVG